MHSISEPHLTSVVLGMQFSLTRNLIGLLFFWQAGLGERKEAHLDKLDEAACVALDTLPPDLAIALSVFDTDSSGILDVDQMKAASEFLVNSQALNEEGKVPIASFPKKDRKALDEWDCDGDGSISSEEILRGFQALVGGHTIVDDCICICVQL